LEEEPLLLQVVVAVAGKAGVEVRGVQLGRKQQQYYQQQHL
jgi:hypothetical protein